MAINISDDEFKKLYRQYSNRELSVLLSCTCNALKSKARRLGVRKDPKDVSEFEDKYANMSNRDLASYFGMSIAAIRSKAQRMKICKSDAFFGKRKATGNVV